MSLNASPLSSQLYPIYIGYFLLLLVAIISTFYNFLPLRIGLNGCILNNFPFGHRT